MATAEVNYQKLAADYRAAREREEHDRERAEAQFIKTGKTRTILKLVAMDAKRGGGITVAVGMDALKKLGYSHKEASGMVLTAMGFKVKK